MAATECQGRKSPFPQLRGRLATGSSTRLVVYFRLRLAYRRWHQVGATLTWPTPLVEQGIAADEVKR
jgi:hypothetical protein